jgi:hypothetical protein
MPRVRCLALALALAAGAAQAQLTPIDPDWKEVEAPPPAPLRLDRLVSIDMGQSSLRFGVIPESVTLTSDRIVRYVVVATSSSGAVNAFYEGIRCGTGEGRIYARHNPGSGWVPVKDGDWRPLQDRTLQHSLVIARSGVCQGRSPNRSPEQIVRDLGRGADQRYNLN